jgi:hypothetical protein
MIIGNSSSIDIFPIWRRINSILYELPWKIYFILI